MQIITRVSMSRETRFDHREKAEEQKCADCVTWQKTFFSGIQVTKQSKYAYVHETKSSEGMYRQGLCIRIRQVSWQQSWIDLRLSIRAKHSAGRNRVQQTCSFR